MAKFWRDNSLSIVLFSLFGIFMVGLALTGHTQNNQELTEHGQPAITLGQYIVSGEFIEATFENWESEFLQMGALVILTIWLRQKGSADSKHLRGQQKVDAHPRYKLDNARTWAHRWRAIRSMLYSNSLSLALFLLFIISFALHAWGGAAAFNQQAQQHGEATITLWQYLSGAQFWYESFQNWQSEFLSVGVLILFSIFLRQRYSPQSKPIGEPNAVTGAE